jgi:hypothetical protein
MSISTSGFESGLHHSQASLATRSIAVNRAPGLDRRIVKRRSLDANLKRVSRPSQTPTTRTLSCRGWEDVGRLGLGT